jgi:hypothetical protein
MDEDKLEKAMASLQGGDGNALADIYTLTQQGRFHLCPSFAPRLPIGRGCDARHLCHLLRQHQIL